MGPVQAVYLLGAYLVGAIPFGLLFGKALGGVDVRAVGSGNIGATNVLRVAGKKAAILTLVADCLKGLFPVLLAARLFSSELISVLSGVAAILGHNFPVYLRFKGGKGVATSFGVVLAVAPGTGLVCLIAWAATAVFWKYSSLSALIAFTLYPIVTFAVHGESKPQGFLSLFVFGMIYYRHRENIKRLIAGTESKIGQKQ
ncbi:MAG: glycerol-3-phosphate acyltransferase [Nitrospirae bacterium]|jgi:glycerol-3-phosphate acyltransferase PlsY|nr:glycerol-3-phosphate acyltransferase [Nitrospirota bacterium]